MTDDTTTDDEPHAGVPENADESQPPESITITDETHYWCTSCGVEFDAENQLYEHVEAVHADESESEDE